MNQHNPLQELIGLLRRGGFPNDAEDIERYKSRLESPDAEERSVAAQAIRQRCQPRWLGDLYIEGISLEQWWGLLERCVSFAKHEVKD